MDIEDIEETDRDGKTLRRQKLSYTPEGGDDQLVGFDFRCPEDDGQVAFEKKYAEDRLRCEIAGACRARGCWPDVQLELVESTDTEDQPACVRIKSASFACGRPRPYCGLDEGSGPPGGSGGPVPSDPPPTPQINGARAEIC